MGHGCLSIPLLLLLCCTVAFFCRRRRVIRDARQRELEAFSAGVMAGANVPTSHYFYGNQPGYVAQQQPASMMLQQPGCVTQQAGYVMQPGDCLAQQPGCVVQGVPMGSQPVTVAAQPVVPMMQAPQPAVGHEYRHEEVPMGLPV